MVIHFICIKASVWYTCVPNLSERLQRIMEKRQRSALMMGWVPAGKTLSEVLQGPSHRSIQLPGIRDNYCPFDVWGHENSEVEKGVDLLGFSRQTALVVSLHMQRCRKTVLMRIASRNCGGWKAPQSAISSHLKTQNSLWYNDFWVWRPKNQELQCPRAEDRHSSSGRECAASLF
jgi:hypothetical protein